MPVLSTIKGWKYGFNSPFKAEVYFVSTKQWTDLKWGTQNPIMMRDAEFGPVRVRAFGTYAMKVTDPATFLRQLVATDPSFEAYEITNQLRNMIVSRIADAIGQAKIPVLDLAGNYEKLGGVLTSRLSSEMAAMGLSITQFYVENISLPPEVEQALDTRTKMGVLGNLDQFAKYQSAEAIRDAAQNPGGIAGMGAGIGAGVAIGQQMAGAMAGAAHAPGQVTPPAPPPVAAAPMAPPPLPAASIYLGIDGVQSGPFDIATIAAKIKAGTLPASALAWKPGMGEWAAVNTLPELKPFFG
jgi:membrane protease subunit (stomatin/prohibitin family)